MITKNGSSAQRCHLKSHIKVKTSQNKRSDCQIIMYNQKAVMKQTLLNVRKAKKKFKQLVSFASRLIISLISSLLKNPVKFSFSSIYGKPNVSVSVCGFKAGLGHTAQARFTMRLPSCKSVITLAHGRSPARPRLIYTLWGMMGRHSGRQLLLRVWTSLQQRLRGGSDFSSRGGAKGSTWDCPGKEKQQPTKPSLQYSTGQGCGVGVQPFHLLSKPAQGWC